MKSYWIWRTISWFLKFSNAIIMITYSIKSLKFDFWKFLNQIVDETYLIDVATLYYRKKAMRNILLQQNFDTQFYLVRNRNFQRFMCRTSQIHRISSFRLTRKSNATSSYSSLSKIRQRWISLRSRKRFRSRNEIWRSNAIKDERSKNNNN